MLYVTTRNDRDAYTPQRILQNRRGADGGFFVPFRIPVFTESEILAFGEKPFNKCVTEILNLMFSVHLTSYDLDLSIGKYAVRLEMLNQRLVMAECWHNPQWQFSYLVKDIIQLICNKDDSISETGDWAEIGVRIAVLFGIFGELFRQGMSDLDKRVDISVISGDFSAPMSAWYAREMGLPIGNIICSCNENSNLWNFICHGQLRTDTVAVKTCIPEADVVIPYSIERLIYAYGGTDEVNRFLEAVRQGKTYYTDDKFLHQLQKGFYVAVASEQRVLATIPNAYATFRYILSPSAALSYIGLQDYRAGTGECRSALILTEKSPRTDCDIIGKSLGLSKQSLEKLL